MGAVPLSLTYSVFRLIEANVALKLQHVNLADSELISAYVNAEMGDLVAPGMATCWPSPSDQRTQFSIQRDLDILHNDASLRVVKVVNAKNELLSVGCWHFYEDGYPAQHAESDEKETTEWPEAFNREM